MPQRIQRKRTKGWKMPPNTVSVTRPGRWGNPWKVGDQMYDQATNSFRECKTAADCVQAFRQFVDWDPNAKSVLHTEDSILEVWGGYGPTHKNRKTIKAELAGKNLACFCAVGQPCQLNCREWELEARKLGTGTRLWLRLIGSPKAPFRKGRGCIGTSSGLASMYRTWTLFSAIWKWPTATLARRVTHVNRRFLTEIL